MIAVRTHAVASAAFECVSARCNDSDKKKYGALAHRLPA